MKLFSHWDGFSSNVEVLSLPYARFPLKFSGKIQLGFLGNPVQEKFYQVVKLSGVWILLEKEIKGLLQSSRRRQQKQWQALQILFFLFQFCFVVLI